MPYTFYAPFGKQKDTFSAPSGSGAGTRPLGSKLVLPDERVFRYALAGGAARVAGKVYQSVVTLANHRECVVSTVPTAGDKTIKATLGGTAAAVDIYSEGFAHFNKSTGLDYGHRIRRAITSGQAHAAASSSAIITVNLEPGEAVDVTGDSSTELTLTRNRWHATIIHASPDTAIVTGASVGVAAADGYYYEQTRGECALTASGSLLVGNVAVPSATTDGTVMPSAAFETDSPIIGIVQHVNITAETALVFLQLD